MRIVGALVAMLVPIMALGGEKASFAVPPGTDTYSLLTVFGTQVAGDPIVVQATVREPGGAIPTGTVHFTAQHEGAAAIDDLGTVSVGPDGHARITVADTVPGGITLSAHFSGTDGFADSEAHEYVLIHSYAVVVEAEATILGISRSNPLKITLTMSARVTDLAGNPVAGLPVIYSVLDKREPTPWDPGEGVIVCDAATDASGYSTCKGRGTSGAVVSLLTGGSYATHQGYHEYGFDTDKAPVIAVGGP